MGVSADDGKCGGKVPVGVQTLTNGTPVLQSQRPKESHTECPKYDSMSSGGATFYNKHSDYRQCRWCTKTDNVPIEATRHGKLVFRY